MKNFEFVSAGTVEEAVKMLAAPGGDGGERVDIDEKPMPLAGGQDLLTTMKEYASRPSRVVNLKQIKEMGGIDLAADGSLKIGALATLMALEEHAGVREKFAGLCEAAHSIASPQIRNVGTVGGNLCQRPRCWYFRLEHVKCLKKGGSTCYAATGENKYNAILGGGPSYIVHPSDLAPMLLALDANLTIAGTNGSRELKLAKFFTLPGEGNIRRENVLAESEIITAVSVPATAMRSTYLKFKERESLDFAMSAVAVAVDLDGAKKVKTARIVLGGVAPIPWRAPKAETFLLGKTLDEASVKQAGVLALEGAAPLSQNAYKVPLTQTLVRRALMKLAV
jgi:xanthine dehydrogenase YagS FAD-binding subunit